MVKQGLHSLEQRCIIFHSNSHNHSFCHSLPEAQSFYSHGWWNFLSSVIFSLPTSLFLLLPIFPSNLLLIHLFLYFPLSVISLTWKNYISLSFSLHLSLSMYLPISNAIYPSILNLSHFCTCFLKLRCLTKIVFYTMLLSYISSVYAAKWNWIRTRSGVEQDKDSDR